VDETLEHVPFLHRLHFRHIWPRQQGVAFPPFKTAHDYLDVFWTGDPSMGQNRYNPDITGPGQRENP